MVNNLLKDLSILKKFLFINFLIFIVIGSFTFLYLGSVQPNLIKKKTSNHVQVIENTIDHFERLKINFTENDIRKFLLSTKFLFQNLDRVTIFDNQFKIIGDTNTLDLDPRSFSQRLEIIEMNILSDEESNVKKSGEITKNNKLSTLVEEIKNYSKSSDYGRSYTFIDENYESFLVTTVKNVVIENNNIGYLAITENANDIRVAINERKSFIMRTAFIVAVVIFIFSYVLNRFFLKPIKNLVNYTNIIKEKSTMQTNIEAIKKRNDELGTLSKSLDAMTNDLQKRIETAENFSTDLVHEIRNPLASLKSASEIISDTDSNEQRQKLIKIISHDVERIERLITDYSQMLKDEAAISSEKMRKLNLKEIVQSVVDDFNNIYMSKRGISIQMRVNGAQDYNIFGIENRIEQIIANLLDNSISFSNDNQEIKVGLKKLENKKILLEVIDQGEGFKEKNTEKIFKRFYSNRPEKFGEHSGLGLNIVKNLVELHNGQIVASNNIDKGAKIEITFPKA